MYAVIRAGGKQYRVAPGDVIHIERQAARDGKIDFSDVLAVSAEAGKIGRPQQAGARVYGRVLEEGRAAKVLVFHYKRKKQYKKLAGHRQPFTRVQITEIVCDGQSYKATEEHAVKKARPAKAAAAPATEHHEAAHVKHPAAHKKADTPKASAHKKSAGRHPGKKK